MMCREHEPFGVDWTTSDTMCLYTASACEGLEEMRAEGHSSNPG
jgi:hypothetical protein